MVFRPFPPHGRGGPRIREIPLRMVLPFPPGGSTDILGRIVAASLSAFSDTAKLVFMVVGGLLLWGLIVAGVVVFT